MSGKLWWIFALILLALIYFGSRDREDPLWEQAKFLLDNDIVTLSESKDSINRIFKKLHPQIEENNEGFNRLSTPFLPTMSIEKFNLAVDDLLSHKFRVFTSIPGVGSTTFINRLTSFITLSPKNILEIRCAPAYELKLHEKYLGNKDAQLIKFIQSAINTPSERFFLIIDNLDKINPESFWGPDFWKLLDDKDDVLVIDGVEIYFPDNFHMISIVHTGITAVHKLSDEHFSRIGESRLLNVTPQELVLYLDEQRQKAILNSDSRIDLFNDKERMQEYVYSFIKSNSIVSKEFGLDHQLGQWSSYRKQYDFDHASELLDGFVSHVNALRPGQKFTKSDLKAVDYAIEHRGLEQHSSWLAKKIIWLEERGYLTEFLVGLSFLLITGLISLYFLKRREKLLTSYIRRLGVLLVQYESGEADFDMMMLEIEKIKNEVDEHALSKKINYNEATFFYSFFDNKVRKIEISREIHAQFDELVEVFLEDGLLSESEYSKLRKFLNRIRKKLSEIDYQYFDKKVEELKSAHSEKW